MRTVNFGDNERNIILGLTAAKGKIKLIDDCKRPLYKVVS